MTEVFIVLRYDPDMSPDFDGDPMDLEVALYDVVAGSSLGANLEAVEFRGINTDDWAGS